MPCDYEKTSRIGTKCSRPSPFRIEYGKGREEIKLCIFHAPIEIKKGHYDSFWDEFVSNWYSNESDYRGFVFPGIPEKFSFKGIDIDFRPDFREATFTGKISFKGSSFKQGAVFNRAFFCDGADFTKAKFKGETVFFMTVFKNADFKEVEFDKRVVFNNATFLPNDEGRNIPFFKAKFSDKLIFSAAVFGNKINLENSIFKEASFGGAFFMDGANFSDTEFLGPADFSGSEISNRIEFYVAKFKDTVDFKGMRLENYTRLRVMKEVGYTIEVENKLKPGLVNLERVTFYKPERVIIGDCDLSRWSFAGTNVENVIFDRETWPKFLRRGKNRLFASIKYEKRPIIKEADSLAVRKFKRRGRKVIHDELLANDRVRDWREVGEVYRMLRKNYEGRLAYETASDFHYGQLECRRRDLTRPAWDWLLTNVYKWISAYGESVFKPLRWLGVILLAFAFLYLAIGIPLEGGETLRWVPAWPWKMFGGQWWSGFWTGLKFSLTAGLTLPLRGEFRETLTIIAALEKLISVSLLTFFVLALRRRFKR